MRNDHPLSTQPHERFKVWPTNADRLDFGRVMECSSPADLLPSYGAGPAAKAIGRTVVDAYLFFGRAVGDWLAEGDGSPGPRIAALYSALRDNVRLVVIDLDEKDDGR